MNHALYYQAVEAVVRQGFEVVSAAEAHGLLAGLLCMDAGIDSGLWLQRLFAPDTPPPPAQALTLLAEVFDTTRRQLDDRDFSFDLLLPDDDSPLTERADALGEWCQGFLVGIGYGGHNADWPGECTEILHDFVEISRLDPEVSGEADENAYAELVEYVRVGVQAIHSELPANTPKQLH